MELRSEMLYDQVDEETGEPSACLEFVHVWWMDAPDMIPYGACRPSTTNIGKPITMVRRT